MAPRCVYWDTVTIASVMPKPVSATKRTLLVLKSKIKKSFIIREKIKTTVKTRFHVSGNQILRLDEEEKINLKPKLLKKIKSKLNSLKNISAIYFILILY